MAIATLPAASRHPALAYPLVGGGRGYLFGDPTEYFFSVTTIIGSGVPKAFLPPHYAKMAADLALEAFDRPSSRSGAILRRWARAGREWVEQQQAQGELRSVKVAKLSDLELAARWLKGAADRHRDDAADRGSAVHAAAEDLVLDKAREATRLILAGERLPDWPERIAARMASFVRFVDEWQPEYLAAEATVFNRAEAYAGTLDAAVLIPRLCDEPVVLDYKAGNRIYPEVAMQLAAYARGEFVGHPDQRTELAMPPVSRERAFVLHLTDTRPVLRPVEIGQTAWDHFRYARENYRWISETSKTVLGPVLNAPGSAEEEENVQAMVESQMAIGFDPSPRGA